MFKAGKSRFPSGAFRRTDRATVLVRPLQRGFAIQRLRAWRCGAGSADLLDDGDLFNGLHSRKHDAEVEFYAFDMLLSDGEDIRKLPLSMRKTNLQRLLARRVDGIHLAPFETGEIGPDLFRHACLMGLEGGLKAPREPVPGRPLGSLDQEQEPPASRLQPSDGCVLIRHGRMRGPLVRI